MKVYLVGGAVRDALLGIPVVERDWVVVGASADEMRMQGFVAADPEFPVFRHRETHEEYALARRERKRGEGYRGFEIDSSPAVTLEQDLARRDLTINAMAQAGDGTLVDPFNGRDDLDAGLLRHVSPAFVEDPVRVLRAARFAAKLGRQGFRIAHGTHRLMRQMVERGDMAHLTAERLWRETVKAMTTAQPWRYFEVLHRCGALQQLVPPLAAAMGEVTAHGGNGDSPPVAALKRISRVTPVVAQRLAATLLPCVVSTDQAESLANRLRADRDTAQLLRRLAAVSATCARARGGDAAGVAELIATWRAHDVGNDIAALLAVCQAQSDSDWLSRSFAVALPAVRGVSAEQLRAAGASGAELGRRLAAERARAVHAALRGAGLIS